MTSCAPMERWTARPRVPGRTARPTRSEEEHIYITHTEAVGDVLVGDGPLVLRRLLPHERWILRSVFDGLSAASRTLRYLVPTVRLTATMEAVLLDVEDGHHVAWVALAAGRPVGIARYVRLGPDRAELAVEVVDVAQGQGIGSALTAAVIASAAEARIVTLEVTVHPHNRTVLESLRRRKVALAVDQGTFVGRLAVPLAVPAPTAEPA